MDVIPFLQVIEELFAHFSPKGIINVIEDIFAIAVGSDKVGISKEGKMVADGGLIHV